MAKLQPKQDRWKRHLQANLAIAAETTLQRTHLMENLSSGETKRTSHQENGGCLSLCLIKKLDMVGWLVGRACKLHKHQCQSSS